MQSADETKGTKNTANTAKKPLSITESRLKDSPRKHWYIKMLHSRVTEHLKASPYLKVQIYSRQRKNIFPIKAHKFQANLHTVMLMFDFQPARAPH